MAMSPRLELRQSQSLVMTPQLQQAIKLLQFSSVELASYVEDELSRNPLLERDDDGPDGEGGGGENGNGEDTSGSLETADSGNERDDGGDALNSIDFADGPESSGSESMDVDYDNLWNNDSLSDGGDTGVADTAFSSWGSGPGGSFNPLETDLEQTLSGQETLHQHLTQQLNVELDDPADRVIGLHLIDQLDEAGYVSDRCPAVAEMLGCPAERVERTLERLQHFDPPGIFARDLAECLALQLRERDRLDPAMQALLENLDLLAKRDIAALMRICGVDQEDLVDMVAEIRALDPKPGLAFDSSVAQPVVPDVIMRAMPNGGWAVELNSETLPRLIVNNRYHSMVSKGARTKEEKLYIEDCLHSANWLVKSLHQRATTILKVATEIVRQQDGFFVHGISALRPLVLRDIAEAIDMHESTVSRVTSNKFISSPRGIYELKYFFSASIGSSSGGEAHSAESVRYRIKALIDAEAPNAVLSDDKIVELLTAEGMDIARRTVAKYREALGIPSSVQRRRQKNSGL